MRNTTERKFSDSPISSRSHEALPLEKRFDEENQINREDLFHLDNLLDSELPFDSNFLLDSEDTSELDDLEGLLDLRISDLRWDDEHPHIVSNSE
jgi:hypothetical protein